ncbi:unnamed protein product, partial [Mycena citricolor]
GRLLHTAPSSDDSIIMKPEVHSSEILVTSCEPRRCARGAWRHSTNLRNVVGDCQRSDSSGLGDDRNSGSRNCNWHIGGNGRIGRDINGNG